MLEEVVNRFIRDTIDTIVDTDDYSRKGQQQGAPAKNPNISGCTVHLLNIEELGHAEILPVDKISDSDTTVTEDLRISRNMIFSINFYATSAIDNANKVMLGFSRPSIVALFAATKIGLINTSVIRNLTDVVHKQWRERAQFDLTVNVIGTDQQVIDAIDIANITGVYHEGNHTTNLNISVTN